MNASRTIQISLISLLCLLFAGKVTGSDTYGSMYIEDSLVHYIQPETRLHDFAVIMVPGLNLSSYIYVTTPDGRPGWAQFFAQAGYDVYVVNDPDFDFQKGGFSVSPFEVPDEGSPPLDPDSEQGWQRDVWPRWGFGSEEGSPYPDTRFPTDDFEAFADNYPYVSSAGRSYSDSIAAVLEWVGPAVLMGHSAGAPHAVSVAKQSPDQVPALILVEPTNPPDEDDFPALAGLSMLGVYGDYIESRNQGGRKQATEAAAELFEENGGVGEVMSMPEDQGVNGNTHLMMQDDNHYMIAGLITDWIVQHIESGGPPPPSDEGLFVEDITVTFIAAKRQRAKCHATVSIYDTQGQAVSGAKVEFRWTGSVGSTQESLTSKETGTILATSHPPNSTGPCKITVTDISHPTLPYMPDLNQAISGSASTK